MVKGRAPFWAILITSMTLFIAGAILKHQENVGPPLGPPKGQVGPSEGARAPFLGRRKSARALTIKLPFSILKVRPPGPPKGARAPPKGARAPF